MRRFARLVYCFALSALLTGSAYAAHQQARATFNVGCQVQVSKRELLKAMKGPVIMMNSNVRTVIY